MKRMAIAACLGYALILVLCVWLFELTLDDNNKVSLGIAVGSLVLLPLSILLKGKSKNENVTYSFFILTRTAFSFLIVFGSIGLLVSINYKVSIVITAVVLVLLGLSLTAITSPSINKKNTRR